MSRALEIGRASLDASAQFARSGSTTHSEAFAVAELARPFHAGHLSFVMALGLRVFSADRGVRAGADAIPI
jgi:hydrogenase/urease accessory protein HupE